MYNIAVIGGGVVGGMIARELSRYNLKLCILEKEGDVAMGATKANSAIVHAGFDAKEGTLKALLNVKGSKMMQEVCKELGVKYRNNTSLVIAFNDEERETLKALCDRGVKNGVEGIRIIEAEEIRKLEPNISENVTCALYAPTGAIVCPYELCIASVGNAMDNGAELFCNFEVSDIKIMSDCYEIISKSGDAVHAEKIINCAGVYADRIAKLLGDDSFEICPRRGEYILLDKEAGQTVNATIFRTPSKMGKGILVTPTVDENLLIGPTSVDIENKDDKSTTSDGLSRVIKEANENIKGGLPFGKSITSFCGLRAVGNTGDFIIKGNKDFLNVAGIESPGLSSAPAIAEYVVDLLKKNGAELKEKDNFNPIRAPKYRFSEASIEEKNEMIKNDPSYGRIVCRCEGISEGEILDAIRSNPPAYDIDAVKRRTRSGMGRCQGGFCGPYVMELIAKETNIQFEDVTKSGGKSYMVKGKTK